MKTTPAVSPAFVSAEPSTRPRFDSVDILRGLVMVLMALDHTRGYFSNVTFYPLDLTQTNVPLFLTRWITHFCAPVFVFLAGTGAFFSTLRGKSAGQLSWFLLSRGLWLVLLELTVIRCLGWHFNFDYSYIGTAGVIWAIGWSMVVLAGLVFLPVKVVTGIGVFIIAAHNLTDGVSADGFGPLRWLWVVLHTGGPLLPGSEFRLHIAYPLGPWIGVMAAGYGFGALWLLEPGVRRRWIQRLGLGAVLLFVALRATNLYGDTDAWKAQENPIFTIFSFINCQKYPPSLLYAAMTLGPALLVLYFFERGTPKVLKPLVVFGRVPLFYYLLHLPLIHGTAVLLAFARHGRADWLLANPPTGPGGPNLRPENYGYDLWAVYLFWIGMVLILYPACHWFAKVKQRRKEAWLSYL